MEWITTATETGLAGNVCLQEEVRVLLTRSEIEHLTNNVDILGNAVEYLAMRQNNLSRYTK